MTDETLAAEAAEGVEAVAPPPSEDVQAKPEAPKEAPDTTEAKAPDTAAEEAGEDEDAGGKRRNRRTAQERIGQLTRRAKELEEENRRLQQAIAKPPKEEDFSDYSEFQRAQAKHAAREAMADDYAETARRYTEEVREAKRADWTERAAEFKQRAADFDEVVTNPKLPITPTMAETLFEMEDDGPALAYYLGKNPHEAARLASLSPPAAAIQMGRMAERLKAPARRTASSAPPPVGPVTGGGGTTEKDPEKMTMAEYRKWRFG
jgi:hypothetical protein